MFALGSCLELQSLLEHPSSGDIGSAEQAWRYKPYSLGLKCNEVQSLLRMTDTEPQQHMNAKLGECW